MLRSAKQLSGYKIAAVDAVVGKVADIYFDASDWKVRYLVVDTGKWLPGRRVLLAPTVVADADDNARAVAVGLTQEQIRNSPPSYADMPVSRQHEVELQQYFGWPAYWGPEAGLAMPPPPLPPEHEPAYGAGAGRALEPAGDPHLHSVAELAGYSIEASDGAVGHLDDLILDDEQWIARYLLVDTRNWRPGGQVIVATEWVDRISWLDHAVYLDLSRQAVKNSPPYDASKPLNREYEDKLYRHYGKTRNRD